MRRHYTARRNRIMRIHEIIREKRLEQKMTQEQLAEKLGVSAPAVNKWEKGVSQTKGY